MLLDMHLNMDLQIWYEGCVGCESGCVLEGMADVVRCLNDLDGLSLGGNHCDSNVRVMVQ